MYNLAGIKNAEGLDSDVANALDEIVTVYNNVKAHNALVRNYYEGNINVELYGNRVPTEQMANDQVCFWPAAAVDKLVDHVRLDGFVAENDMLDPALAQALRDNHVIDEYQRNLTSKYVNGCMFATIGRGTNGKPYVRFHSAESAAAVPDETGGVHGGIVGAGLAVARVERTRWSGTRRVATLVNVFTPGNITTIEQVSPGKWVSMGTNPVPEQAPMIVAFTHRPNGTNPLGRTRITKFVRALTDDAVRAMWNMEVAAAFYSMPMRYLLGLTDEQYDAMVSRKNQAYIDSWLLATADADGRNPQAGQFPSNSPTPFIEELRCLATMFAGATGIPVSSLGIIQDNPSSAEALTAAREDIGLLAETDIRSDSEVLRTLATMVTAVAENKGSHELEDSQREVVAQFKKPIRTSVAASTDAITKLASQRPSLAQTDVFLEQGGLDEAQITRVKSDEKKAEAAQILEMLNGAVSVAVEETEG